MVLSVNNINNRLASINQSHLLLAYHCMNPSTTLHQYKLLYSNFERNLCCVETNPIGINFKYYQLSASFTSQVLLSSILLHDLPAHPVSMFAAELPSTSIVMYCQAATITPCLSSVLIATSTKGSR
jgi:hypothetical protein